MLDDKNTINDINPFVDPENFFPPGSSKHVVDFQKYKPEEQDPEKSTRVLRVMYYPRVLVDQGIEKKSVPYLDLSFQGEI